jgi:hypothetical protein
MSAGTFNCPSCGGSLEVEHRFSKVVICSYCGQTCSIKSGAIQVAGKKAELLDLDSVFKIGASGTLEGQSFKVLGCLRYEYEDGFWDEWFLRFEDGKCLWLQEDEGEFTAFEKESLTSPIQSFPEVSVGGFLDVNSMQVFVTEKSKASIAGGAGELFFSIKPGAEVNCVDGNSGGKLISIEYTPEEINLSIGREIPLESFAFTA